MAQKKINKELTVKEPIAIKCDTNIHWAQAQRLIKQSYKGTIHKKCVQCLLNI